MIADDLPLGLALTELAGWNQTPADWRRFLTLAPDGCFVGCLDGQPLATAAAFTFDTVGWIAMILVHPDARGRGLGTALTGHAIEHLDHAGVATIRLDATPAGQPIYESFGFEPEYPLHRYEGRGPNAAADLDAAGSPCPAIITRAGRAHLDAICRLDRDATATDRRPLLSALHHEHADDWLVALAGDELLGYAAARPGRRARQLGPVIARDADVGVALLDTAARQHAGQPLFIDIPDATAPAVDWARRLGLTTQRPLLRMARGRPPADVPHHLWASSGPEKG